MRCIYELTTEEAYHIASRRFGHVLPPLEAIENEDWGRDYVLQCLQGHSTEELASAGLTWDTDSAVDETPKNATDS
ncbi:MAG: hypothetical protein KatS3mg105_2421 [Gemmatales bacterium]|nr:MAG: hypothetical protein KatS3mg105_2421 [Gemmatales bacterium]